MLPIKITVPKIVKTQSTQTGVNLKPTFLFTQQGF